MDDNKNLPAALPERENALSEVIANVLGPVMESMAKMMRQNTEAIERLAASQKVQNDRMEALEKQIRLNTLVTAKQVRYLNDAIRDRARELLDKRALGEDKAAIRKLGNAIRKSVLARYGIAALHEIPKHEYSVAMSQIKMWMDNLQLLDVVREARARTETEE